MGWLPSSTTLGTVDEGDVFNFTITYSDDITGLPGTVTLIANDPDPSVIITNNNIAGKYEDIFDQTIKYRTKQDTFVEVQKWSEINTDELYGVYHFIQDPATTKTYTFEATAGGTSQTYSIIVNNDIDYDKRQLAKYVNPTGIIVTWTNANGNTITWVDNNNNEITWTT